MDKIVFLIVGLICFICGGLILYAILRPRLKNIVIKNKEVEESNAKLAIEYEQLLEKTRKEENIYYQLQAKTEEAKKSIENFKEKSEETRKSIENLKAIQATAAENFYKQALEVSQNSFDKEIERISNELEKNRQDAENIYTELLKDSMEEYQKKITEKQVNLNLLEKKFQLEQTRVDAAVAAAKRQAEIEQNKDFYSLILSQEDIEEIKRLREVLPYLRDKEPLNKVIYQVYYSRPYLDLIGRVVGQGRHTGIYKITNTINGMCYVGQSVDIAERWRQHIKRGVGAEPPTRNKLYPAMQAIGVENFTFEIIEECDKTQLDEREDFWQEYFHAKDFGYSIK